jgi:hypothetical protein
MEVFQLKIVLIEFLFLNPPIPQKFKYLGQELIVKGLFLQNQHILILMQEMQVQGICM